MIAFQYLKPFLSEQTVGYLLHNPSKRIFLPLLRKVSVKTAVSNTMHAG